MHAGVAPDWRLAASRAESTYSARIHGGEASQPRPDRREHEEEPELQEWNTNSGLKALSPDAYKCLIYFHAAAPPWGRGLQQRDSTCLRVAPQAFPLCRGDLVICYYPC